LHDGGKNFSLRQPGQLQVLSNSPANVGKSFGKLGEPVELVFIAHFAPALVISVLLAATRVAARRLDVAVR